MEIFEKYDLNKLFADIVKFLKEFVAELEKAFNGFKFVPNYENPEFKEENSDFYAE